MLRNAAETTRQGVQIVSRDQKGGWLFVRLHNFPLQCYSLKRIFQRVSITGEVMKKSISPQLLGWLRGPSAIDFADLECR